MKTEPNHRIEINNGIVQLLTPNKRTMKYDRKVIGELRRDGDLINLFKIEKEKDRFQKTDAWGVNLELFEMITGTINIKTELGVYRIDKQKADLWKRIFYFKEKGIEPRCFIPVKAFEFTKLEQNDTTN